MTLCVIPARYASTRLPAKPLAMVEGRPLVMWAYDAACRSGAFETVLVATDDPRIVDAVVQHGGTAVLTSPNHQRGTDRVWEVARQRDDRFIVNLQGDEPEVPIELLRSFVATLHERVDSNSVLTCVSEAPVEQMGNPNVVKVVLNRRGEALYFSRCAVPHGARTVFTRHTGIYGFCRESLERFCSFEEGILERSEKLEQLRALENGMVIHCLSHAHEFCGIDTPRDLEEFRQRARDLRLSLE